MENTDWIAALGGPGSLLAVAVAAWKLVVWPLAERMLASLDAIRADVGRVAGRVDALAAKTEALDHRVTTLEASEWPPRIRVVRPENGTP